MPKTANLLHVIFSIQPWHIYMYIYIFVLIFTKQYNHYAPIYLLLLLKAAFPINLLHTHCAIIHSSLKC